MTAQTVSGAVAVRQKQDQVVAWIRAQQDDIAMIAASHVKPSAIVRVTQGALRRNEKLMAAAIANPQSLLYALLDAARLGHEPDTDDYYLVPFGNEVQGIEGYKGIIERMYRAGGVSSVVAQVVRQRDQYRHRGENTPPVHEYDDFASPEERGPMRGAYAYATLPLGECSQVIRMGRAEIMEHKAKSRGSDRSDSPWQQWEAAMWKKTVLRALEPYVPTSTEYRHAPAALPSVVTTAGANEPRPAAAAEPVYDAEIVEEPRPQPREPENPTAAAPAAATAPTDAPAPAQTAQPARERPDPTQAASGATGPSAATAAGKAALDKLADAWQHIGITDETEQADIIAWLEPQWSATRKQVTDLAKWLDSFVEAAKGDKEEARHQLWTRFHDAHPEGSRDG